MADFKVTLLGYPKHPQTLAAAGALGCFEEKSSAQIMKELLALPREERLRKERAVLKNSFGRGHGSVGDQVHFTFSIEGLPRAATFQLCLPEYLEHLQQSLRRAKATRGYYLPEAIKDSSLASWVKDVLSKSFELYEEMVKSGIPEEDARFILPLYTKTNIQTTCNARELCHLWKMTHETETPSIVRAVVDEMLEQVRRMAPYLVEDFGFNYETLAWYPSAQLYGSTNPLLENLLIRQHTHRNRDNVALISYSSAIPITEEMVQMAIKERNDVELANLKHVHFEFLVSMSLACLHQAIRQRTWNHSVESIYDAVRTALTLPRIRTILPPSIEKSDFLTAYINQHDTMLNLYQELLKEGISRYEAIGVIPHSVKIYTLIHVNGWNALHSIGKRTCVEAQWEIRRIAREMARIIKKKVPALGKWAEPQCITYGYCPEIKDCGYYKKKKQLKGF